MAPVVSDSALDETTLASLKTQLFVLNCYDRLKCACVTFVLRHLAIIYTAHNTNTVCMSSININAFCLVAAAPASGSNGDFGEWNAFPGGQMPAAAQTVDNSGSDLFGAMTAGPAIAPAPAPVSAPGSGPASADLFDLMGPTQSLTSSQSLNFSMSSTQSMSTTVLPQSRSQVCMIALIGTRMLFLIIY